VGTCLVRAGRSLLLGATWREAWEEAPAELRVLEEALVHAWEFGAPAAEALRSAREISEREALARAKAEAQRLGVRLVVPLGLCFLPSFILLAVVPLVAILAGAGL
jgi:pilus assembly protein TadC